MKAKFVDMKAEIIEDATSRDCHHFVVGLFSHRPQRIFQILDRLLSVCNARKVPFCVASVQCILVTAFFMKSRCRIRPM